MTSSADLLKRNPMSATRNGCAIGLLEAILGLARSTFKHLTLLAPWQGNVDIEQMGEAKAMGDDWRHTITIEAIETADPSQKYPRFVDGARRGPPEDVGGIPGYYEFLNAMAKPRHREHRRMIEWYGGRYDPDDIDALHLRLRLGVIAKRRHAGKAAYQKRQANS
jgi:hypothetical protein